MKVDDGWWTIDRLLCSSEPWCVRVCCVCVRVANPYTLLLQISHPHALAPLLSLAYHSLSSSLSLVFPLSCFPIVVSPLCHFPSLSQARAKSWAGPAESKKAAPEKALYMAPPEVKVSSFDQLRDRNAAWMMKQHPFVLERGVKSVPLYHKLHTPTGMQVATGNWTLAMKN